MKERLFVDTNIFLYFLTKHENKWERIADIFDNEKYGLATNVIVFNELKYKLLWLAASKKLGISNKFSVINLIKKDKKLRNDILSKFLKFYINIKHRFDILDIKDEEEILSCSISAKYGLLPSDASILASMITNNIKKILTNDADFKKVDSVQVIVV